jgi:carbonyl reductase 1
MPSAVITGADKGLGYSVARQLLSKGFEVVLACRDTAKAAAAADALIADSSVHKRHGDPSKKGVPVRYVRLDLEDEDSFGPAANEIVKLHPDGVDVIVHNAGVGVDEDKSPQEQADAVTKINYFATRKVAVAFMSTVRNGGRIIFMSSRAGMLQLIPHPPLRERFVADWLTPDDIGRLLREYIKACGGDEESVKEAGWPLESAYGMSKLALTALVRVIAIEGDLYLKRGVTVNSCCPGRCVTDMTDEDAPRTAEEGADTAVWLATTDDLGDATGRFYAERRELDWENMPFEKAVDQARQPAKKVKASASG